MAQSDTTTATATLDTATRGESLAAAKSRIPRNLVSNWIGYAVGLAISFFLTPFIIHHLGNAEYGVWALTGEFIGYMYLLDFGTRIASMRFVARHHALNEQQEVNGVLSTSLYFSLVVGAIALVVGLCLASVLPFLFHVPPELTRKAQITAVLVACAAALSFPGNLFYGCNQALSRFDLISVRNASANILRALLIWVVLGRRGGLVSLAVIGCVTTSFSYGFDWITVRRQLPWMSLQPRNFEFAKLKTILNFSIYAFVMTIASRLLFMADKVVVGSFLGTSAVAFYAIGGNFSDQLRNVLVTVTGLYAPLAAQMDALKEKESLRRLFLAGSRFGLLFILPAAATLIVLRRPFLTLWVGESYAIHSAPVLVLLSISVCFYALSLTSIQVLYGVSRHKVAAWLVLGEAIANLLLSIVLVKYIGATGVAWGTIIPAFIIEMLALPIYTARVLGIACKRYYVSAVLRPLVLVFPYAAGLLVCNARGFVHNWASLAFVVTAGLIIYLAGACLFGLDTDEKRRIAQVLLAWVR